MLHVETELQYCSGTAAAAAWQVGNACMRGVPSHERFAAAPQRPCYSLHLLAMVLVCTVPKDFDVSFGNKSRYVERPSYAVREHLARATTCRSPLHRDCKFGLKTPRRCALRRRHAVHDALVLIFRILS